MNPPDNINPEKTEFDLSSYSMDINQNPKQKESSLDEYALLAENKLQISGPEFFHNYELSWLDFNFRVLDEARKAGNPPLERAKFIGIVCSNLDEFFQKRVGGLKRQHEAGMDALSVDGLTPVQQLRLIRKKVKELISAYRGLFFNDIIPELGKNGIEFRTYNKLKKKERATAEEYFRSQLYPILTPLVVDQGHPFPFISNKSRSFAVEIRNPENSERIFARIKVPENRPRWLKLNGNKTDKTVLINIDEIIREHLADLFPGGEVLSAHIFRITRNADIKRQEEEADDLLEQIEEELRERRFAEVVRMELDINMPAHIKQLLIDKLRIESRDVYEMEGLIGLTDCLQLGNLKGHSSIRYKRWTPAPHPAFRNIGDEKQLDVFSAIRAGDIMVHHPYHSFNSSVERFIHDAASDPKVLAIKQTLYRTSSDSPLMHALMKAAEAGKQVAVLIELKARFDEERNIGWAMKLEKAGIHVSYGLPGLKIHSKITVVVRDEGEQIRRYVHIGTGNYHPGTANLYEDIGLFTCDENLGADVSDLFNFLTGYAPDQNYRKLLVAPHYLRKQITALIDYEVEEAKAGSQSGITMKMNSLEDPHLIQKLYYASSQGVPIDIIVRGVCRLKAGLPGISENIRIHSVIGRFLEHSRIYYFNNSGNHLYFVGSADLMHRNLDSRVEAITPVESPQLKKYLRFLFHVYLSDTTQRWELLADGTYIRSVASESDDGDANQNESENPGTHHILMMHTSETKQPVPAVIPDP